LDSNENEKISSNIKNKNIDMAFEQLKQLKEIATTGMQK